MVISWVGLVCGLLVDVVQSLAHREDPFALGLAALAFLFGIGKDLLEYVHDM
jgi:hypothetical protein